MTPLEKLLGAWLIPAAMAADVAARSRLDAETVSAAQWAFVLIFMGAGWGARNLHELIYLWQGAEKRLELGKSVLCGILGGFLLFLVARYMEYADMVQNLTAALGAFGGRSVIEPAMARFTQMYEVVFPNKKA